MMIAAKISHQSHGWTPLNVHMTMVHQCTLYKNIPLNQKTTILNMRHFLFNSKQISIQETG
eukprot:2702894-Prorocentrum_lima.AAC.1